ncbi:unnamed protein product [Oncorhynchus mykiss]|uniref:Uncharacterized protein n=1 Tax=Oncorhynchus mykiss TaxID=8022 RepID=A0A060WFU2_ONCMY|nr:unnamed protein product [Oncorhynchus mykiss]
MWQGLQSITDYKKKTSPVTDQDVLLPGRLTHFFARFEDNTGPLTRPANKTCGLSFTAAEVSKTFKRVNPRKAADPDGIPSHALRACADQLAGVFTDIFNQSLSQSAVPTCFKRATIVPVPKKAKVHRRCNLHHTGHCPNPSGQEEYLCENAVHRLQLSI